MYKSNKKLKFKKIRYNKRTLKRNKAFIYNNCSAAGAAYKNNINKFNIHIKGRDNI